MVLIPAVAIPVSLIGAVFLMQMFGFSLNLLTLLAVVLSVGLVVDDAIVMVENVARHLRQGRSPVEAALISGRELVKPIFGMTITLAAVYAPIGFQGGLTGALFREFAFTLAGAVLISGIVAVTLSPVMASRLLRPTADQPDRRPSQSYLGPTERPVRTDSRSIACSTRGRVSVLGGNDRAGSADVPAILAELAPVEDQGVIFGILDTPANATVDQMSVAARAVFDVYSRVPEMQQTFQLTQADSGIAGLVTEPWGMHVHDSDYLARGATRSG